MDSEYPSTDRTASRVRDALVEAGIGREILIDGLAQVGGLGEVEVVDRTATVTVTLPIPARDARQLVARNIRDEALAVDGITRVECQFDARAADGGERADFVPDVKNVIAVASGKGGVGKSTVAVNLAASLADVGASVGLLDADVYGPNTPAMLGLEERTPDATLEDTMVPREAHGVKVMSMGFIAGEDDPVIWRGPLVDDFLKQLFGDVAWGELDYLVVDLPPGTGDAQLSLVQHLPVTGAVIVTTPQAVAVEDARRGLRGFARYDVPVLGIVGNMAGFECSECGSEHDIFDTGGADQLSAQFDVPVLGKIPLDPEIGTLEGDMEQTETRGISVPVLGKLQLPRTREERERPASLDPMAIRERGTSRQSFELLATRTAARINALVTDIDRDD